LSKQKASMVSKVSNVFKSFGRNKKMNTKNVWFLGLMVLALMLGLVLVPANADMRPLSGTDASGRDTGNEYSIRGIKIWVEGDLAGVDVPTNLGNLQIGSVIVRRGSLTSGGHELTGREGTTIKTGDEVWTDSDGRYSLTFLLPFETITDFAADFGGGDVVNVTAQFTGQPGENETFDIQAPVFKEVDPRHRSDDVFKNGDTLEFDIRLENATNDEIEVVTLLPDFSALDSAFGYAGGAPADFNDLEDLVAAVKQAIKDGRLVITDDGAGRYSLTYKISDTNTKSPGNKRLYIYSIDYPSVLDPGKVIDVAKLEDIFDEHSLGFEALGVVPWQTNPYTDDPEGAGYDPDLYVADIILDNRAPNFDFAMINPFVNPPKAIWKDSNYNGIVDGAEWGIEDNKISVNRGDYGNVINYVYKPGDTVSVMVQINSWDLALEEFRSVDAADAPSGRRVTIEDINLIGDLSGMLDPKKVDLVTDVNGNGIPDAAESLVSVVYSGRGGGDDDYDRHDASGGDDDEDFVDNGFNERFIFTLSFTINENFKAASGNGASTIGGLPFRFAIADRAGNIARYSTNKEVYNPTTKKWVTANVIWDEAADQYIKYDSVTNAWSAIVAPGAGDVVWNRARWMDNGLFNGGTKYFRVRIDDEDAGYPDNLYPNSDAEATAIGQVAVQPDPNQVPIWNSGRNMIVNWDKPWAICIDAAAPTVSRMTGLYLGTRINDVDGKVANGAAVVPQAPFAAGGALPADYGETAITTNGTNVVLQGNNTNHTANFIYEVSGGVDTIGPNLVTLEATFPSDMDVDIVKFMISDSDAAGSYRPMKGTIAGDRETTGLLDIAGNVTDEDTPGALANGMYQDRIDGDDDADRDADLSDREVSNARTKPQSDSVDNDADGLVDGADVDESGILSELYEYNRDEDEDGVMDEDAYAVMPVRSSAGALNLLTAKWTIDPVRIVRSLGLVPGKVYAIKAFAVDKTGKVSESAAAPIYVVFNVIGKGITDVTGTAKAVIKNSNSEVPSNLNLPAGYLYYLEATTTGTVPSVTFQYSLDKTNWSDIPNASPNPDDVTPFRAAWTPKLGNGFIDWNGNGTKDAGDPDYLAGDPIYIRAIPGRFGNLGKYLITSGMTTIPSNFVPYDPAIAATVSAQEKNPDLTISLNDSLAPIMVVTQVGDDVDLTNGALVPVSKDVYLRAVSNDLDVSKAVFQYAKVFPDGKIAEWTDIPTTLDPTILPGSVVAVSKWDTTPLVPTNNSQRYDLRVVPTDKSGLTDAAKASIIHVVVGKGKYVAFITDPAPNAEITGVSKTLEATVWIKDADVASIDKVIFQYRSESGNWTLINVDSTPSLQVNHSLFSVNWSLYDVSGKYFVRALVEDDQGYINEGLEVPVTVKGAVGLRAKVSNFESDSTKNPRVSMAIARAGSSADIWISDVKSLSVPTMKVRLNASVVNGAPGKIMFQYKINDPSVAGDDDPTSDDGWKNIAVDVDSPYSIEWVIGQTHELANLKVATLVYVRALAFNDTDGNGVPSFTDANANGIKEAGENYTETVDVKVDEGNYVPYVGMVFEETWEPTAIIERIERDGVNLGDLSIERRVTGGSLLIEPYLVDQAGEIVDHRASGIDKIEVWYKYRWRPSYDGDTNFWVKAAEDNQPPFAITWDVTNVPTGKYDVMLVAYDHVGNISANIWNDMTDATNNDGLLQVNSGQVIRKLIIDRAGPDSYLEKPGCLVRGDNLGACNNEFQVALDSYEGSLKKFKLQYCVGITIPSETRTGEGTYTFQYLDVNNNGIFDSGEPYWILNPPGQGTGLPSDTGTGGPTCYDIVEKTFAFPTFPTSQVHDAFVSNRYGTQTGIYYWDKNGNGRYEVGETVWVDHPRGNTGRYNSNKHLLGIDAEAIIMGCEVPPDETAGKKFEDIPNTDIVKNVSGADKVTGVAGNNGISRWADINNDGELDSKDFIWIDMYPVMNDNVVAQVGDKQYTHIPAPATTIDEGGEPIIYAADYFVWTEILKLPPTNNSMYDIKVKAQDKNDSANKEGNWGNELTSPIRISNIEIAVWGVNGRAIENNYDSNIGGGKDYYGPFQRVTGNQVKVKVRVKPQPIAGSKVELWFRYDNKLYPGAIDANFDGVPDGGAQVYNSRWDGIDNDWDGSVDEVQADADGNADRGEVNKWVLASTTGGTTVIGSKTDDLLNNYYEVELTWDVSMLKGEFSYEFVPVVVDGQGSGVSFNYAGLPWVKSAVSFPQKWWGANCAEPMHGGYKVVVDHQGPYTYATVTKDTKDYVSDVFAIDSFDPLDLCGANAMIMRTNDAVNGTPPLNKRNPTGDYTDEAGEDNGRIYDLQAKTVSIVGGLDYTKSLSDTVKGVKFEYRPVGGEWKVLGYDYDPDYISTFEGSLTNPTNVVSVERGNGASDVNPDYMGTMLAYDGVLVNIDGNRTADVTAYAPRIIVATWSLDNIDIANTDLFPWTNGTEYEFRVIGMDQVDKYGGPSNVTNPDATSVYDELAVENRVGDDKSYDYDTYKDKRNALRDIDWKRGVPFDVAPNIDKAKAIFTNPHADIVNLEAVGGPRSDGKVKVYAVDNIIPKADIIRVDETTYPYTADAGVDPAARSNSAVSATVMEGDDVLLAAIVNANPDKKTGVPSIWGTDDASRGDVTEVIFYARQHNIAYTGSNTNKWERVGMGNPTLASSASPSDAYSPGWTVRVDTELLMDKFGADVQLIAIAKDDHCNTEPLATTTPEVIIHIEDMKGPKVKLGGLALDIAHYSDAIERISQGGITAAIVSAFSNSNVTNGIGGSVFGDPKFVDWPGLDYANFGNAVFPADLLNDLTAFPGTKRSTTKISGESLDLYVLNAKRILGEIPATGVTVSVIDKNNTPVFKKTAEFSKDVKNSDGSVTPAKVSKLFTLSESTARIYLPTWKENDKVKSRFEGVRLFYSVASNTTAPDSAVTDPVPMSGTYVTSPNPPFGDNVAMTMSYNSKGEPIWSATLNLEAGKTYFYYYVVDTVGDTWVIPDPKNMTFDDAWDGMTAWYKANMQYIVTNNFMLNIPIISKLYVPGSPASTANADDEIWFTRVNLDSLADGVYEIRVDVTDSSGYQAQAAVSHTVVLDRTAPAVDAQADLKVAGRVKANSSATLTAVLQDQAGINALQTYGVLFEVSRESKNHQGGNTAEATSVWQYAMSSEDRAIVAPEMQALFETYWNAAKAAYPEIANYNWLKQLAFDIDSRDGWSVPWLTPDTDMNFKYYVRVVPFDDALNVQVDQDNQVEVWVDGTVPKAKILTASVNRDGATISDGADGFEIRPTDKDVTLSARIEANSDGDLNLDGIIDPGSGEDVNHGVKNVKFEYSLREFVTLDTLSEIKWYAIPATQYSDPVLVPNADGSWTVKWQVDFSKLYNEERDQYIYLRAVAEDEVGNKDDADPILSIMVLNDTKGPKVQIDSIKGPLCADWTNALSPHLALSRGVADVKVRTKPSASVAAVKLEYRQAGAANWIEIKTVARTTTNDTITVSWDTSKLEAGRYELQAVGYDGDGNASGDVHAITVIVDYTEPTASLTKVAININHPDPEDGYETVVGLDNTGVFRYATKNTDGTYTYFDVYVEAKADATDPTDKVEAKSVVLQYFERSSASWQPVKLADGTVATLNYSKTTDKWTKEFKLVTGVADNRLGKLIPGLNTATDGELWLRALATDYACNDNKLDKGVKILADANPPSVIAVFAGSVGYEGGASPTIVDKGGDPVDVWAKIADDASGVASVKFYYMSTKAIVVPPYESGWTVYNNDWCEIGASVKSSLNPTNGYEELWTRIWETPKQMFEANETYTVAVVVTDNAGNSISTKGLVSPKVASVKVERDVTAPAAPVLAIVDTFAGLPGYAIAGTPYTSAAAYENVPTLSEYNAALYTKKRLPVSGTNYLKYEVFNTHDNANGDDNYAGRKDELDSTLVLFIQTDKIEYGCQPGKDPGLNLVRAEWAFDPNGDGDPSDITAWNVMIDDNKGADPDDLDLDIAVDAKRIPIRDADGVITGYNYYFVMGDDPGATGNLESIINTARAADGVYIVRAKAADKTGNWSDWGYGKFKVHNSDKIAPANSTIITLNGTDDTTKWTPLEWKFHKVMVRTFRNLDGVSNLWYYGATPNGAWPYTTAQVYPDGAVIDRSNLRFFNDIKYVAIQAFDNESNTWVEIGRDAVPDRFVDWSTDDVKSKFYAEWDVWVDSTLVGDGTTKMRAIAVDNCDPANAEAPVQAKEKSIMIDNPRAQVVLPGPGEVVERGITTLTIQGVPVELAGWDTARNGADVGQIAFLVRRKAAPTVTNASGVAITGLTGIDGPWILLDAKDDDLDGEFGEDPDATQDYDGDGVMGEDGVTPSDTNEPYMVFWTVPDWLVVDDPQTETVIEDSAQYWVVAVAGDANTGPLDSKNATITNSNIHWDNPEHIIRRTNRAVLITVTDLHPPKTRILQVDRYKNPSEVKMVVGKTVTVFGGDTEVDWVPPGTFPTPNWGLYWTSPGTIDTTTGTTNPNAVWVNAYPPITETGAPLWPADGAPWTYGLLYPTRYNPELVWENQLINEWRPQTRIALRYAGPYTADATAPSFPTSGQNWEDTPWKVAEADAIHMDINNETGLPNGPGNPGTPEWQVTNWTTGSPVLPDGKYFIAVTATDDIGHTTGVPVGTAEAVMPDIAEIYIDNNVEPIVIAASELQLDGTLVASNKEMERGQPLVLSVDPKMNAEDLDQVTFQFKTKHDYDWATIDTITTQPYSVTLSPVGGWDGQTGSPSNIVLGAVYQFRAVGQDQIGNKAESNIIELTVVDKEAMASIARIIRVNPATNDDEVQIDPQQINMPRLTGQVNFMGYTDSDIVAVTFRYRAQGVTTWIDIEGILHRGTEMGEGGLTGEHSWDSDGYIYAGMQEWSALWDTTTLTDGIYEVTIVANTGENKSTPSNILTVVVDHNSYDIIAGMTDSSPKSGEAVGGWTRRPVSSQNPILDPDQKEDVGPRGEADVYVTFGNGFGDLDMGVPTNQASNGTALLPALRFEYKESTYPNVGNQTTDDSSYWKPLNCSDIVYDAASKTFSTVWHTATTEVLNGYYDIRVKIFDEAGNVAYKVFAEKVVVDNTGPDARITSIDNDRTLTYDDMNLATDTEIATDSTVTVRATAIDSLTKVHSVQFQVRSLTLQRGQSTAGDEDDEVVGTGATVGGWDISTSWVDVGLLTKDANPADSYSLTWNTTGLYEGDYALRIKVYDVLGNMTTTGEVKVTVVDTTAPIASIVGYYPNQLHFLSWPKKYWYDTIYAATTCQADIQEVQFQYRSVSDSKWITIGVPIAVPVEYLDTVDSKLADISNIQTSLFPTTLSRNEAIIELFNWTGLWGVPWTPNLPDGTYQLRAVAKDWSGNVDPDAAPVLTMTIENGVAQPITENSGIKIEFSANLGGTGVGDRSAQWNTTETVDAYEPNFNDTPRPTVVVTVDAPEKPIVLILAEFNAPEGLSFNGGLINSDPNGLVVAGELLDMLPVNGQTGKWAAALEGDELPYCILGGQQVSYLELLRLGGKLVAFVTTNDGVVGTTLAMDDIKIYSVTPELGTNGTAYSKDGVVSVTVPRASLFEEQPIPGDGKTIIEKLGLMITPTITPNTPKDQRVIIEPVGQAYNIEFYDYWSSWEDGQKVAWWGFRPGFEPQITLDYSGFNIPAEVEAKGFISVRYWDSQYDEANGNTLAEADQFGKWANDEIINLSVDTKTKKIKFNLKRFAHINESYNINPIMIFSVVLEKSLGRIDDVAFYQAVDIDRDRDDLALESHRVKYVAAYRYPAEQDISYMTNVNSGRIYFRIVDPAGIDESSIKLYVDGVLLGSGEEDFELANAPNLETDKIYYFDMPKQMDHLTEGLHTVKIEAWDKSDAVDESNWLMLEKTAKFYIDRTSPVVVTSAAQKDGLRYFKAPEGATVGITMVDEGVGLSAAMLQKNIFVDVFKHLTPDSTTLRTNDQGNVINYQRKTLIATSKPILEYADDYTADSIDNETWVGVHDGASDQRHKAWRASYTIQTGQIADGDTFEAVFYYKKPNPMVLDLHNENAVYLYEDLTKAYLAVWDGGNADNLSVSTDATLMGIVAVPATQVPDFYKLGIANLITTADPFMAYYQGTFLTDILGNGVGGFVPDAQPMPDIIGAITGILNSMDTDGDMTVSSDAITAITNVLQSSSTSTAYQYDRNDMYFTRQLVADTRGPVVVLDVPQGVRADDPASTVSATITDDGSGISLAQLVINGKVVSEKKGPISNVTLDYTFGKGEVVGANEIKVVVVDQAGNETVTRGSFGVQEVDAPVISDMTPVGEGIASATPTIGAAYSDKSGIDLNSVTMTLNGAVLTNLTIGESKVSYTPTSPLKAGVTYTAKLSVKDKAGASSEMIWTFAIETEAPAITDTTPVGVDSTGMPVISAKYADSGTGINKDTVKLMVDKQLVEAQITDKGASYISADIMAKGKHVADLSVADMAGNVAQLGWEFSIEEVAPAITDVLPSGTINDDMPVLSAKYSDSGTGIDVKSVVMTLNGEVVEATVGEAQASFAVKEALKPGVGYIVGIKVADKAGNIANASSNFRLEGTAPVISGMSPSGTVQNVDVAVSANYSDAGAGIDITTALMKVDGVAVNATASASGISYQATKLIRGDHTVYVEVADNFGNVGSQSWSFKVEDTPPVISVVEPNGEINTATPVIKATYSDAGTGVNVASVVLSLNGQILPAIATATQVSFEVLTPLEKGVTYKVAIQVADKAGNIASKDASFSLETKAPTVSSKLPSGTVSEADAAKGVTISAKLADDGSGINPESAKMWLDGAPVMVNATAETATYVAKGLSYGEHNVRLVIADMLGNTTDATWKFSVADSTPPTVTVVSPKENAVVGVRPVIRISYADEGSGVDLTSIAVKIDDSPVAAGAMAPAKPSDSKVVSAGESSYEVKLSYGPHVLTVVVKDVAGNEATAEVKFMVEDENLKVIKPHNYPNPFGGDGTKIKFVISKTADVTIRVFDFTGTLVATVVEDEKIAPPKDGIVERAWDGTTDAGGGMKLATGIYFCQIVAKTESETKSEIVKLALVRD